MSIGVGKAPILCVHRYAAISFRPSINFGTYNIDIFFACIDWERKRGWPTRMGLNRGKIIHINDGYHHQPGLGNSQFMSLLDLAQKSDDTDQRDKVYEILGLM